MASLGAPGGIVCGMGRVIDQAARLAEDHERIGTHVGAERVGARVQMRKQRVGPFEIDAFSQLVVEVSPHGIGGGPRGDGIRRPFDGARGQAVFAHGEDGKRRERRYGLAGARHDAAYLVYLVSEEIDAHGKHPGAREDVHGAAAHAERARPVELSGILEPAGDERIGEGGEIERLPGRRIDGLAARRKLDRREDARVARRKAAHHGRGARHHDDGLARCKGPCRPRAQGDRLGIRLLGRERIILTQWEARDRGIPDVRGKARGECGCAFFARHDDEHALRLHRIARGHDERTRGCSDAEGGVLPRIELCRDGGERVGVEEGFRKGMDQHTFAFGLNDGAPEDAPLRFYGRIGGADVDSARPSSRIRRKNRVGISDPTPEGERMARENLTDKRARAAEIERRMFERYGEGACSLDHMDPFTLTIAVVLSAQCTDAAVNKVTPILFAEFPDAYALANAPLARIEEIIHPLGFFRTKAKKIIGCAQTVVSDFGGVVPRTMDELTRLPGVGRKTANVVMAQAFRDAQGIAVDTHVFRIAHRLGFATRNDDTPEKVESKLLRIYPKPDWLFINHQWVHFGREFCQARNPRCAECFVADVCPFPAKR